MDLFDDKGAVLNNVEQASDKVSANVDKLKAFADVKEEQKDDKVVVTENKKEPKLDFDVDFDTLNRINDESVVKKEKEIKKATKDDEAKPSIVSQKNERVFTETNKVENKEGNQQEVNRTPLERFDAIIENIDNFGDDIFKHTVNLGKRFGTKVKYSIPEILSNYQDKKIHALFEKGKLVLAGDFEFLMYKQELMVYRYLGSCNKIVIPDYVGNLPVRYIYRGFLNRNLIDNQRMRSFLSLFKEDRVRELSLDSIKDSMKGVTSVQLPKELTYVPRNLFSGMKRISMIVIPEEVRLIAPSAFMKSGLKNIYFECDVPQNFSRMHLPNGACVFCLPGNSAKFRDMLGGAN